MDQAVAIPAIAREMAALLWAIAREVEPASEQHQAA
jgi:hypothetical protein